MTSNPAFPIVPLLLAVVLLSPSLSAQDEEQQDLAYALPSVEEVHLESFADFRALVAKGKWSRAFRAIGSQIEDPPEGFLAPNEDGFAFSWREGLWRALADLPPAGRRAFRLFHDAKARRALVRAESADEDEIDAALDRVFSAYFITKSGDDVAERLAARSAARGDHRRAAFLLEALIEHHPDTDLDPIEIRCGLARSLTALGDTKRLERVLAELVDLDGERVLDGEEGAPTITAWAERLRATASAPRALAAGDTRVAEIPALGADGPLHAEQLWRVTLKDLENKNDQNNWNPKPSAGVPDHRVVDGKLALNHAGQFMLLDIATGEEIWKLGRLVDDLRTGHAGRCFVVPAGDRMIISGPWKGFTSVSKTVRMTCRDMKTGKTVWNTVRDKELKPRSFLSRPLIYDGVVFAVTKREGINAISLVAVSLDDGSFLWEVSLGTPVDPVRNGFMWFGANGQEGLARLRPRVVRYGAEVVVLTDGGAVIGVDPRSRRLSWAFTYDMRSTSTASASSVLVRDNALVFSTLGQKRIYQLDVERRRVRPRPVCPGGAIVGEDDRHVYVFGDELQAYRRDNLRRFRWAAYLKRGDYVRRPLLTPDSLLVYTGLGLVEIDRMTGDARRTIRAGLPRMKGASLVEHEGILVAISPQGVIGFRLHPGEKPSAPPVKEEAADEEAKDTEAPAEKADAKEPGKNWFRAVQDLLDDKRRPRGRAKPKKPAPAGAEAADEASPAGKKPSKEKKPVEKKLSDEKKSEGPKGDRENNADGREGMIVTPAKERKR